MWSGGKGVLSTWWQRVLMRCLGSPWWQVWDTQLQVVSRGSPAAPRVGWVTDVDSSLWRPYNHTAAEPELNLFKKTGAASVYSSVLGPWHSCLHTAGTQGLSGNDCPHFTDKETEAERG